MPDAVKTGTSNPGSIARIPWRSPRVQAVASAILISAGFICYRNTFSVPFLFDDDTSVFNNPTIRHLWPPWEMLAPPTTGAPVTNRPLANASLALNYALGGLDVEGYHVFNLTVHLLVGLLLFAIIRRTFEQPVLRKSFGGAATPMAWLCSLLWLTHPLLTEPVTYVVGRTEVLMGLFYLATLYAAICSFASSRPAGWMFVAVMACLAGMATKEVMASAPLMVFLYDRTFVAGSFGAAWKARGRFYLALAATLALLAWLLIGAGWGSRGGSVGFSGEISWWQYLLTQFYAIVRYLRLSIVPWPLILDYGRFLARGPMLIVPCALFVLALVLATLVALRRSSPLGFLGAWFFAILAPSSSVVPVITQTIAERRMYLALPAIVILIVVGLFKALKGWYLPVGVAIAVATASLTVVRNRDYRSAISIWEDTVAKWPDEPRPHVNLGLALMADRSRVNEAIVQFEDVIRLKPDFEMAYCCLGSCLALAPGREREAEAAFRRELSLEPNSALGRLNYGLLLGKLPGRQQEALVELQAALTMQTNDVSIQAQAHAAYGSLLVKMAGRREAGIAELRKALDLFSDLADAHASLGVALAEENAETPQAAGELEAARKLKPDSSVICAELAGVLAKIPGRKADAIIDYEASIRLDPGSWQARYNLGKLLMGIPGRTSEAEAQLEAVVKLSPGNADAHTNLGVMLAGMPGHFEDSVRHFEAAVRANPAAEDAHFNLGAALAQDPARQKEAIDEFQAAIRLKPSDTDAHFRLGCILAGIPGKADEAIAQFETTLDLRPGLADAHFYIAELLQAFPVRIPDAIQHLEAELRVAPNNSAARELLAKLTAKS